MESQIGGQMSLRQFDEHYMNAGHFRAFITELKRLRYAGDVEEVVELLVRNQIFLPDEEEFFDICDILADVVEDVK